MPEIDKTGQAGTDVPEVTEEMVKAGVEALQEWLDTEDRFIGWDGFAVRDVFLRMCGHAPEDQIGTSGGRHEPR